MASSPLISLIYPVQGEGGKKGGKEKRGGEGKPSRRIFSPVISFPRPPRQHGLRKMKERKEKKEKKKKREKEEKGERAVCLRSFPRRANGSEREG